MKTTSIIKSLIPTLLAGMLSFQNGMAMPAASGENPIEITSTGKVKAISYFKDNSLKMMLHVENLGHEKMMVQILNGRKGIVYHQYLGNQEVFIARYSLQDLPDGDYTIEVKSATYSYSKTFSIQTSISREVKLQKQDIHIEKQEAI
ncbi:hypothetical protein GXP67_28130 [Rhodocytophaga rosea]|uniref:Uncharacterized protein n=1 Tax=Rhodocytophaga rosea TaxID=2704465 RepID=A0A6C0GQA7_9BACT|nr:hypothetical protein [Rhodocytophaga rosea]QHT70241.1 hypothetical protein GXP67_28130 [Rhodocytophaga rosea]